MAIARKCDRCSSYYSNERDIRPYPRVVKNNYPCPDIVYDLCPKCMEELEEWLKDDDLKSKT